MENLNKYLLTELQKLGQPKELPLSVDFLLKAVDHCQRFKIISGVGAVGLGLAILVVGWAGDFSGATVGYLFIMAVAAVVLQILYARLAKKEFIYKILLLNRVSHRPKAAVALRKSKRNKDFTRH